MVNNYAINSIAEQFDHAYTCAAGEPNAAPLSTSKPSAEVGGPDAQPGGVLLQALGSRLAAQRFRVRVCDECSLCCLLLLILRE